MADGIPLPVLLRRACLQLLGSGCEPQELVSGLIGAAVDLSRATIGPATTCDIVTNIALMLDEDLHSPVDSGNA